jgi:hypothetical protein
MPRVRQFSAALTCFCLLSSTPAAAGTWDILVSRLCQLERQSGAIMDCGGGYTRNFHDTDPVVKIYPDNAAFRALMSELGVVFAPDMLSPADTQGFGGFTFQVQFGFTKVNPRRNSVDPILDADANGNPTQGHRFWRAAQSVENAAFAKGDIRTDPVAIQQIDNQLPPGFAPTMTIMARKGLWFPLPSFEAGVGVRYLMGSQMWGPTATAKLAIHEGFQGWPVPALAVRGSGTRVIGTPDFNLTVVGLDASISKHFGVVSTFNLTPYAGYQLLWIIADSEQVDATPAINPFEELRKAYPNDPSQWDRCRGQDCFGNFAFADLATIVRHRAFVGLKLNFYIATLMLEYTYIAPGSRSSTENVLVKTADIPANGGVPWKEVEIKDASGHQHTIAFSVGLDF